MLSSNTSRKVARPSEKGQAIVEYIVIMALIAISAMVVVNVLGPTFENTWREFTEEAPVAPPSLAGYIPPPTAVITATATSSGPTATPLATNTPGPSPTATSTYVPTVTPPPYPTYAPTATPAPASNLCTAAGVSVSQSSTANGGVATRACDGNTNGNFGNGSVATTQSEQNAWWEVDLGTLQYLYQLKIFSRTDCCQLANFYVFVSDDPFYSTDLQTTRQQYRVSEYYFTGGVDFSAISLNNTGRYIRIQLAGTGTLNLAELQIIGTNWSPPPCEQPIDLIYIFDLSGSMTGTYVGTGSKISAAKAAITTVNNDIALANPNSRVGFVTFHTNGWNYTNGEYWYPPAIASVNMSSNIANINTQVNSWSATGGTPTGAAIEAARQMLFAQWQPSSVPLVILVSDGVPTVSTAGIGFNDYDVQAVPLYSGGVPRTPNVVETEGNVAWWSHGLPAGHVSAEAMRKINTLKSSFPGVAVHSVAIQSTAGGIFNAELLQYVADVGQGSFYSAQSPAQLSQALDEIVNSVSCNPPSS